MRPLQLLALCGLLALVISPVTVLGNEDGFDADVEDDNVIYQAPDPSGPVFFLETFNDSWASRWIHSKHAKYAGNQFKLSAASKARLPGDKGLLVPVEARHYAVSAAIKPIILKDSDLVVQYEVKLQDDLSCGGAYMKLLHGAQASDSTLSDFNNDTPYVIMFGPDRCGSTNKVHFIFRHQNPVTKQWEEKHLENPPAVPFDKLTHLYTLHVRKDNTFDLLIDGDKKATGSLLESFAPPVNPPAEIDDPKDKKPADWDEREQIPDPTATKPEDWDEDAPATLPDPAATKPSDWLDNEPALIDDPEASKPSDWNDEEDGEWEPPKVDNPRCSSGKCGEWTAPRIANPAYKGKWSPPLIPNPAYKGIWAPRKIPNPAFFEDKHPHNFAPINAIGFELWTMNRDILFDNILITNDISVANNFADKTFKLRSEIEQAQFKEEEALRPKEEEDDPVPETVTGRIMWALRKSLKDHPIFMGVIGFAIVMSLTVLVITLRSSPAEPKHDLDESDDEEEKEEEKKEEEAEKEEEESKEEEEEKEEEDAPVVDQPVPAAKEKQAARQRKAKRAD